MDANDVLFYMHDIYILCDRTTRVPELILGKTPVTPSTSSTHRCEIDLIKFLLALGMKSLLFLCYKFPFFWSLCIVPFEECLHRDFLEIWANRCRKDAVYISGPFLCLDTFFFFFS